MLAAEQRYFAREPPDQSRKHGGGRLEASSGLVHPRIEIAAPVNLELERVNSPAWRGMAVKRVTPGIGPIMRGALPGLGQP